MNMFQVAVAAKGRCDKLANVDYSNFSVSLFILIGILISYLPQHIRIVQRRTSFGLSPYFVLLGTTSGTCAFANIIVLPASRADMQCCHEISGFSCFAGLLGVAQVGTQWSCFTVILLLFLIFFPRATPSSPDPEHDDAPTFKTALSVMVICVVHAVVTIALSAYFILARPRNTQGWANFLGIAATVLSSIQYFPQIYTTYRLRRVGSLSIPMMCIQTPGSFVWAASLASRYGPDGWSAWGVYMVTGCLQGTLLVMGSYFEIIHRRKEREEIESQDTADASDSPTLSEETPLLRSAD